METKNPQLEKAKQLAEVGDNLIGDGLSLASNKVAPIVGPFVVSILWKHKWKILIGIICLILFFVLAFESLANQTLAGNATLRAQIPKEHQECIQSASVKFTVQFDLLAAYGKVIANFDAKHKGAGRGFLEIDNTTWQQFGTDGNNNNQITEADICDNYFTLANKLSSLPGDANQKIDAYTYSRKGEVKKWFELFSGASLVPYGNPIGLERKELVRVTSTYNLVRIIFGKRHVHSGTDVVPSAQWFKENPGKGSTDVVNKAISSGRTKLIKDKAGALCVYVTNKAYRTMYCHCNDFIVKNDVDVKYGDPLCHMGSTGFSTAPHTHVTIWRANGGDWERLDPAPFMFPN